MIIGSPFYDDPMDKAYSMDGGALIPGDGHLQVSRARSPYGVEGLNSALTSIRIHWAFEGDVQFKSGRHAFLLERFWQLFVAQQGGEWVTFDPFMETALKRIKANAPSLPNPHTLQKTSRLEMIRLPAQAEAVSIFDQEVSQTPLPEAVLSTPQPIVVALRWDCPSCDLDLYAQSRPRTMPIYFHNPKTAEGQYWKDFRGSDSALGGFEIIEFSGPVDLRKLSVAVNFYAGQVRSPKKTVSGEMLLSVAGQTYAQKFEIKTQDGNKGAGVEDALQSGKASNDRVVLFNIRAL